MIHMRYDEVGTYFFSRACHNHCWIVTLGARCLGQSTAGWHSHLYDCLHARIHACVTARRGYTMYWSSSSVCSAQEQVLHCNKCRNLGCSSPKAGLPPQTQEPRLQFYQRLDKFDSFPLLFVPHSLFSIWTELKRFEMIPEAPTWRWGECIWLTGPSGLHWNSPQGLNHIIIRKTWKGMNQTKMEGGTERHLLKTDDWRRRVRRWAS